MANENEKYLGYLKYSGRLVEEGLMDTRKSAEALLGFDDVLRYFILRENSSLKGINFELPVRIKKGSWGIWIPVGAVTILAAQYANSVAKKAGSDGFFETGPAKDITKIIKGAIKAGQWMIKIGSHVGAMSRKSIKNARIERSNNEIFVLVENDDQDQLTVPKKYFDYFVECPEKLFSRSAGVIEKERTFELGIFENDKEECVTIPEKNKFIFYRESNEERGVVLPELKHGQFIELEGDVTRATESTNTIGFHYMDHTIICKPQSGNIAKFKSRFVSLKDNRVFSMAKITGVVDRTDKFGGFKEKRPTILFSDLVSLEEKDNRRRLFRY
ncbi:MAG: hypothetical protein V1867_08510 [Candidatus Falkowbacteria bacterium]